MSEDAILDYVDSTPFTKNLIQSKWQNNSIEYDADPRRETLRGGEFLPAGLKLLTRAAAFGTLDVRDNGDDRAVWSATGEER